MTTNIIQVSDLPAELQTKPSVQLMVDGANSQSSRVAPCLFDGQNPPTEAQLAEAKLLLLGAIIRWIANGAGGATQQAAGPFSMTNTTISTGYRLWPTEITQLQEICAGTSTDTIGSIDTAPGAGYDHLPWCNVMFGSSICSCGFSIAARPIYENKPGL